MIHFRKVAGARPLRSYSLSRRLALLTALWSALVLVVTGLILTALFRQHAISRFDDAIHARLIHLVSTVSTGSIESTHPAPFSERTPFDEPMSGWAWQVRQGDSIIAQSGSLGPLVPGATSRLGAPAGRIENFVAPDGTLSRGLSRTILLRDGEVPFVVSVAGPRASIYGDPWRFSALAVIVLALFGAAMFFGTLSLTRYALRPLRDLRRRVEQMKAGTAQGTKQSWPREVVPAVNALENLNAHVAMMVEESRHEASDLAHALKTPLAIIGQVAEQLPRAEAQQIDEQVRQITHTLDWHLNARRLSRRELEQVDVRQVVDDVRYAMTRLFEGRQLGIQVEVEPGTAFFGCEEDLHEVLGNLVDNACKWARRTVRIICGVRGEALVLRVDDDGPGIPEAAKVEVMKRGARMDETAPGHGFGLAIVRSIVRHYGGEIAVSVSALGGACIDLTFPQTAPRETPT